MGKIKDRRTALPPVIESAGQRFADDVAMAGIEYAAVFVSDGKVRGVQYSAGAGCVVTAAPVCGGWFEFETVGAGRQAR